VDSERDFSEYAEALRQIQAARESDVVERALGTAREHLGMDVAYLTTIDEHTQTIEAVVGDTEAVPLVPGAVMPVEETYCRQMLDGNVPNLIPDTRVEPSVRDLAASRLVRAYLGVPVRLSDGRVHGTLCALSRQPQDGLGQNELRFVQVLADMVATRVERAEGEVTRLTARGRGNQAS
jgi:GAF domain-containing protein